MNALLRSLALVVLTAAAALPAARAAQAEPLKSLHPDIALLDAAGANVLASGQPVSTMTSCGTCHDTGYIA